MINIKVVKNGPLLISGQYSYIGERSESTECDDVALRLCRCGKTGNRPFCDGSHQSFSFVTSDSLNLEYVIRRNKSDESNHVNSIRAMFQGPLIISGSIRLTDDNEFVWSGERVKLCRCGSSKIKPFCDGAHKKKVDVDTTCK
jgi:CDGSH-type Zn-finger protein